MKKLVLMGMCAVLCFQMTACSGGAAKDTQKKEEAMALLGDDLTSGELVIDGKKYSFPDDVSKWTEGGWHISNRYDNTDTFELEYNVETNVFEMFNDEKSSEYVSMCAINLDTEPKKIVESTVSYLDVDLSQAKDAMYVVLPGGITCESTKEDVRNAYGEPDAEDDDCFQYLYTNEDGLDIVVEINFVDHAHSVIYSLADSNWGSVTNAEECAEFINAALETSFYGKFDTYVDENFDTLEGAQELYDSEVQYYAEGLMYYLDIDYETVDEEIAAGFREVAAAVLAKFKWDAPVVDLMDGVPLGSFELTMYPTDYLDIIIEDAQAVADSGLDGDEYAQGMLDAIRPKVDEISYREPITKTYDLDLNNGVVSQDDWENIDDVLMDLSE
ncbi:MAG: hypothetical protein K2N80_02780 [Lachnospiraceae bacterium]|nr:hypothetical protein [Lachnospiraceae bacterium]